MNQTNKQYTGLLSCICFSYIRIWQMPDLSDPVTIATVDGSRCCSFSADGQCLAVGLVLCFISFLFLSFICFTHLFYSDFCFKFCYAYICTGKIWAITGFVNVMLCSPRPCLPPNAWALWILQTVFCVFDHLRSYLQLKIDYGNINEGGELDFNPVTLLWSCECDKVFFES